MATVGVKITKYGWFEVFQATVLIAISFFCFEQKQSP